MAELPKAYDPAEVEDDLYRDWEQAGLFHAEPDDPGEPFSIVIPPPNVTGSLHIGHALTNAVEDAMIRHAKMHGKNAVWVPGTDHAGIATQNVVERQLEEEGLTRHDLGREAFLERVWEWREESGGVILTQLRKLGCALDWEREAFTFDEPRSRAVREVFVGLHEQGLIYRGYRLINWCPRCATALSDIEVDHEEVDGEMAHFVYPYADRDGGVEVATTRAETMLGDTAIAVHPDDERYTEMVGRTVTHPFFDRELPIIADEHVDPEFGTGAVKITPAHDPNDYDIGERHDLEVIDILTDDAVVNDNGGPFAGMDRFEARRAVKEALDEKGLLREVEAHTHQVGHCSRCGTVIEPRLSEQWFVEVRPLADKAIAAVHDGRTRLIPKRYTKPFLEWLENLHDWCISRQIWWGHRIPAWYCPDGHVTVARDDPDECAECGKGELTQDEDVLDTWFSSQLWPFTVFGWEAPGDTTPELETWYPTSILETGYDINTFWVSRMLMIGLWFLDEVPFEIVWNHGMVRDAEGKKMSKSFGNVIDPLDFIERYGADALRFALFQHCSPGQDVPLAEEWVEGGRRFANKLWNATRFALGTLDDTKPGGLPDADDLTLEDRWILSRLAAVRERVDGAYERYEWSIIAQSLYHFAWDELADWYLEAAKVRLYGDDETARQTARQVLAYVLERLLRLMHPVMPFLTEALWRALTGEPGGERSLMATEWPSEAGRSDEDAERDFAVIEDLVTQLRKFRSQNDVAPSKRFDVRLVTERAELLDRQRELVTSLAGLSELEFVDAVADDAGVAKIVFGAGEAYVELAGLIDVEAELARLEKELGKAQDDLERSQGKLANDAFVENAPDEVVQQERDRSSELERVIREVQEQMGALRELA
ncbi:MAG: valine--tRNA ligase [Nitriliruptorales bacterium]|nr:valine--tRNA ligase [Nitriliruptorales bacterium]